jgi:hypothetical protein
VLVYEGGTVPTLVQDSLALMATGQMRSPVTRVAFQLGGVLQWAVFGILLHLVSL